MTAQVQTPPSDSLVFEFIAVKSITSAHSLAKEDINHQSICPEALTQAVFELETALASFDLLWKLDHL